MRNQFRSLDDDEIDFLDSVLETEREQERALKNETNSRLATFRKQRTEVERVTSEFQPSVTDMGESWAVSTKKRKVGVEKAHVKGVKLRKVVVAKDTTSNPNNIKQSIPSNSGNVQMPRHQSEKPAPAITKTELQPASTKASLLTGYSSDEED